MTLEDALSRVDSLKPNAFRREEKIAWLRLLDGMVTELIHKPQGEPVEIPAYTPDSPGSTVLLVPEPYSELYLHFLAAQMDLYHGEYTRYNNEIGLFNTLFQGYANAYRREHLPPVHRLRF